MARKNSNNRLSPSWTLPVHDQASTDRDPEPELAQQYQCLLPNSSSRVMSGQCTFVERDPRRPFLETRCTCPAGLYDTPTLADTLCMYCTHRLADHENAKSNSVMHSISAGQQYMHFDSMTCPREETVSFLWERIRQFHVVHVRATPASGKSTLSQLLQNHVQQRNPDIPVFWCSWPETFPMGLGRGYSKLLRHAFDIPQNQQFNWMEQRALLIIDEAQISYACGSLWNDFIKSITPDRLPMIILFSSWGSATSRSEAQSSTPILLTERQRISIRSSEKTSPSVFFTYPEFLDVVERVKLRESQYGQKFLPDQSVVDYVWRSTNGHPAGVRATLNFLATSKGLRSFRKNSWVINLEKTLEIFEEQGELIPTLVKDSGFGRGLPPKAFLQKSPKVVNVLRDVLLYSCIEGEWVHGEGKLYQADEAVNLCYRQGWIHAELAPDEEDDGFEKTVYIFPSVLHQQCIEWLLSRNTPPFPASQYPSVYELCMEAIKQFSPVALNSTLGRLGSGAERRPLEAVYQDELYRSCCSLLGDIYLLSEWNGEGKNGRVDFLVRGMNWAIECVRDGSRLDEHVQRFLPGGRYHPWILSGNVQDYILLDFRKSLPKNPRNTQITWLYHIVFDADYSMYEVYDSNLRKQDGPVYLMRH